MSTLIKTKFCAGLSDISDSYAGFIIDQWGVLHNGEKPYDGVLECLKELKARKKYIIILSNSGKRSQENKDRLKDIGIAPALYDQILTSGEMTWQGIHDQSEGIFEKLGKKVYVISRGNDLSIVNGLDVEVVTDPAAAEFLMISGSDAPDKTLEDYEPVLKICARNRITALCANPDSLGVMGGINIMGPGTLARRYQDFGGVVHYIGKPHQPIFKHCIKVFQEHNIFPGETIVVGDSLSHDILGGQMVNLDTCLVKTGIHAQSFQNARTPESVDKALNLLAAQYNGVRPKYLVGALRWGNPLPDRKHKKRAI